jgi:hypothetical protein
MPEKPQRKKQAKIRRPSEEDILHLRRSGRYIPPPQKNWRDKFIIEAKAPLKLVEKCLIEPLANLIDRSDLFRILEKVGFLIAVLVFLLEVGERREKSIFEAWQVVKDGQGEKSGVVVLALEKLKKEDFSLSGINVKKTNLSSADLSDADLSDADVSGANLKDAKLSGADLKDANLRGANLRGANLRSANLRGADFRGADLKDAKLSGADLRGADLKDAKLSGADLTDVYFKVPTDRPNRFTHVYISGANFSGAKNLTPEQVKQARNWEKAKYDEEFRSKLGLPPEPAKNQGE